MLRVCTLSAIRVVYAHARDPCWCVCCRCATKILFFNGLYNIITIRYTILYVSSYPSPIAYRIGLLLCWRYGRVYTFTVRTRHIQSNVHESATTFQINLVVDAKWRDKCANSFVSLWEMKMIESNNNHIYSHSISAIVTFSLQRECTTVGIASANHNIWLCACLCVCVCARDQVQRDWLELRADTWPLINYQN